MKRKSYTNTSLRYGDVFLNEERGGCDPEKLKRVILSHVSKVAPGHSTLLNNLALRRYGVGYVDLFLRTPLKFYELLIDVYGGDKETAKYVFTILIIKPIATWLKCYSFITRLVDLIAVEKNERKFKKLLNSLCIER